MSNDTDSTLSPAMHLQAAGSVLFRALMIEGKRIDCTATDDDLAELPKQISRLAELAPRMVPELARLIAICQHAAELRAQPRGSLN